MKHNPCDTCMHANDHEQHFERKRGFVWCNHGRFHPNLYTWKRRPKTCEYYMERTHDDDGER